MKLLVTSKAIRLKWLLAAWVGTAGLFQAAHGQAGVAGTASMAPSFCASDGQPRVTQLLERFINADCDTCWQDPATPAAQTGQVALDWVVPGSKGDDAPLSAVATRDAQERLAALRAERPAAASAVRRTPRGLPATPLRVAHGPAVGGYMGASVTLKPVPKAAVGQVWTAWLALVEAVPAGVEGSPVARNLVRNLVQVNWDGRKQLSKNEQLSFFEQRSMSVASNIDPARLRVVGWLDDAKGQLLSVAASQCVPDKP